MKKEPEMTIMDDGAFTVFQTRWDTYAARDKDGKGLCSGIDKDAVIYWAREHLNGFATSTAHVTNITMSQDTLK